MSAVTVVVTGAAGRIAYSLLPLLLSGKVFGPDTPVNLRLLDIPIAEEKLKGVVMELEDSGYELLNEVLGTTDPDVAFVGAEVVVILGGFPRLTGMERKDLLIKNAELIQNQVRCLNKHGNEKTKVLVVANPANTNCLVATKSAPNIPARNFTCLTRLDQERLRSLCAQKVSQLRNVTVKTHAVTGAYIWGNHSTTQVAHLDEGSCLTTDGEVVRLADAINQEAYDDLLRRVQNRGAEIIKALQLSSGLSAAEGIAKHLRDWVGPRDATATADASSAFSMGVVSDGNEYGIEDGLVFSFPCERCDDAPGGYRIVRGLAVSAPMRKLLDKSTAELQDERDKVKEYLS